MSAAKSGTFKRDLQVAGVFFKQAHAINGRYLPLAVLTAIVKAASPFVGIIVPKFILDELMGAQRPEMFLLYVAVLALGNGLLNAIGHWLATRLELENTVVVNGFEQRMGGHIMNMPFEDLENPDVLDQKEKALFPIQNNGAIWWMAGAAQNVLQHLVTLFGLVALIATLNLWIVGLIVACVLVNALIFRKSQKNEFRINQSLIPINREFSYYITLTTDATMGKDIRAYDMCPYILQKVKRYAQSALGGFYRMARTSGAYEGLTGVITQLQVSLVAGYLALQVIGRSIGIGDFTMYVNATASFSASMTGFLNQVIQFRQACQYLDLYFRFGELPEERARGERKPDPVRRPTITFEHVSFRYPRADKYALEDVSITIHPGEKLSVVGPNGAGKTTFIKLLCRLYAPEKGRILLDGVDIQDYDPAEYRKLLSVVFQDYKLFSFTVRENLAFDRQGDEARMIAALKQAGVYEAVEKLPKGLNQSIYKNFDEQGTELSGGQMQKLAIARAIYQNAPLVVLDEPTAALDPYAEFEIYSKFNELIQGKTAVYISHRLSSCRFCDHIAVFDQGRLVEYGTHRQLEAAGGKYAQMWQAQAQYYQG
ncbi:MAG: ABC transporter ATP-binding protein [Christensenellales bacterium]|jgi:ABC-type multidrug transport system fused ATPase/permease subunit